MIPARWFHATFATHKPIIGPLEMIQPLLPGCEPRCPACRHRQMMQEDSVAQKTAFLQKTLSPWHELISPVHHVAEEQTLGYRDKVTLATRYLGGWQAGVMRRDELIPIPHCPVHTLRVNQTLALLLPLLPPGTLFQMVYWVQSGAQLVLVIKERTLPPVAWFTDEVAQRLKLLKIEGFWLHLHPSAGKRIFGKGGWHLVWGQPRSSSPDGMWYGPAAFQQLIPSLYAKSLAVASSFLMPDAASLVVDLYCGAGGSLRRWREAGATTVGVEVSGDAVELAPVNAPRARVLRGSCHQRLPQLTLEASQFDSRRRLLYANPPRTGLEARVTQWIVDDYQPARIAYMSCSAGTLHRDLRLLETGGYRVQQLIPFDFFPRTLHVECVALVERV